MTTNHLLTLALQHFKAAPPGKGQLLYGAWVAPKNPDSLQRLIDDVKADRDLADEIRRLDCEIAKLEAELEDKEALIEALKDENEELNEAAGE